MVAHSSFFDFGFDVDIDIDSDFDTSAAVDMGWTYNTVDDAATNAPAIAAVGITFTTLSFVVVALRMYVRGWMIKAIGAGELGWVEWRAARVCGSC